ncbi:VOC family protein [Aestuariibaculum sp. YM273]|uniref:VOC family protein n=1 Tax=Aestuariibaculum sp. YM273 TaxID=3070659 RepID=UPI0027DB1DCC|nr:VOC family protein [Aestuariibaculum sp. YM273]WMI65669.1 VOC family protein [Aestuariibaculum sp. YM273]
MNLNQVTIPSINVEKAVTFYQTLGLRLIVDSIPRYARFECPDGNSTFSIHKVEALPKGQGITIYFEVDNLEETVLKLQLQDIVFKSLPEDKPWLWSEAHLNDLDGNHIIIYHAGENRKNPPWRIS